MAKSETEAQDASTPDIRTPVPDTGAVETDVKAADPDGPVVDGPAQDPVIDAEPAPQAPAPQAKMTALPPPAERIVRSGPGFGSLVLGGAAAALIGAGAAIYALPYLPAPIAALLPLAPQENAADKAVIAQMQGKLDALSAELDTVRTTVPPAPDLSGVQTLLDQATAAQRTVEAGLQSLTDRVATLETRPAVSAGSGDTSALQGQIDALRTQITGADTSGAQAMIDQATAEAKSRIDAMQAEAAQLRNQSEAALRRGLSQASVARVAAAFESGAPLSQALNDAEATGLTIPAVLRGDVPTLVSLETSFPEAARVALIDARKATAGDTVTQRLTSFFIAQTGARSVEPREGADPDAVLSRAQAAVDDGDLARAVSEIAALPQQGQAALAGWVSRANTRLAAAQAVSGLAQSVQ